MNPRIAKLNELIKQEIGKLFLIQVNFPKGVLVTVTKVETSADLRYTDIFLSIFPFSGDNAQEIEKILKEEIYFLQRNINKKLSTKPLPRIRFKIDRSGEQAEKIDKLIKKLNS